MCTEKLLNTYRKMFGMSIKGTMGEISKAIEDIIFTLFVRQETPCTRLKIEFGTFRKRIEVSNKIECCLHVLSQRRIIWFIVKNPALCIVKFSEGKNKCKIFI